MTIKLVWTLNPGHHRVGVYVGADRDHLALAGLLTLRHDEAKRFRTTVRQGIQGDDAFHGILESGWHGDE